MLCRLGYGAFRDSTHRSRNEGLWPGSRKKASKWAEVCSDVSLVYNFPYDSHPVLCGIFFH